MHNYSYSAHKCAQIRTIVAKVRRIVSITKSQFNLFGVNPSTNAAAAAAAVDDSTRQTAQQHASLLCNICFSHPGPGGSMVASK